MKPTPLFVLTMKSTPLPRWLVIGNSAIIIGISAAFAGMAIAMIVSWNTSIMLGGLVLLPSPLAVGSLQYVAGFRRKAWAATVVGLIHLSACGLFGLTCLLITGTWILEDGSFSWNVCELLFILLCVALYCGFCAWMNLRMGKYLHTAAAEGGLPDATGDLGRYQFTLRKLLGAIAFVSIMASVASYAIRNEDKQYEEHITREEAPAVISELPEGATDVCYCRGGGRGNYLAYEFTIDETGFLDWAKNLLENSRSSPAKSIDKIKKGDPFTIERYKLMMPNSPSNEDDMATITQGYFYWWVKGDKGFTLAYDSANQRAYYSGSK